MRISQTQFLDISRASLIEIINSLPGDMFRLPAGAESIVQDAMRGTCARLGIEIVGATPAPRPVCPKCESESVYIEDCGYWDSALGDWRVSDGNDSPVWCGDCGHETTWFRLCEHNQH